MMFDATHTLGFINRARTATGRPALARLSFARAVRVDERHCVLAHALNCEVGAGETDGWRDAFVLRFADELTARRVGRATGQPVRGREVLAPEELAILATGFDHGWIRARDAWYAPPGQLCFDDLTLQAAPAAPHRRATVECGRAA